MYTIQDYEDTYLDDTGNIVRPEKGNTYNFEKVCDFIEITYPDGKQGQRVSTTFGCMVLIYGS